MGEAPSLGLAATLQRLGLPLARLKTGTPPRLDGRTIDWAALEPQPGDDPPEPLSWMTERITNRQVACAITATTPATHALIRANLHRTAVHGGRIKGVGPRYCPSIEDKVVRFAERERHQIFLEPEGLDDDTVYPNGISTSLPEDVQAALIATIPGLERAASYGPAMRSNTTMSTRAPCGRRWRCGRRRACSWPGRSTAPRGTRRRRHKG